MSTEEAVQLTLDTPDALLACILDMGELLLTSGAEVFRVEDTLSRLCAAYGFTKINVFSITSSIVLTVEGRDGRIFTQTRRIVARDTNLQRVAQVNALSRQLCSDSQCKDLFPARSGPVLCGDFRFVFGIFRRHLV